jgi:hypothetical protein
MSESRLEISWSKSWKSLGTVCAMRWNGSTSTWPKSSAPILCECLKYASSMRLSLTRCRNFADVFKTPGKLRGKTPRTARKRDALEQRQPLTDVFAPNLQAGPTPAKNTAFYEKVTRFQIAEDSGNVIPQTRVISRSKSPQRVGLPGNTDSGYHGMTEDEMDADNTQTDADTVPSQSLEVHTVPLRENQSPPRRLKDESDGVEPASDESFMSAKEAVSHNASKEQLYPDLEEDNATVPDEDMEVEESILDAHEDVASPAAAKTEEVEEIGEVEEAAEPEPTEQELHAETTHDPSEISSPAQPLARKSSFTFSSLPAREPLTAKRSIGGRNSHMDAMNRNSVFTKSVGKSFGVTLDDDEAEEAEEEKEEEQKSQNKTSAQLLHERISMLGKAKESRSSKSIPQALYPQLPENDDEDAEQSGAEDAPEPPPKDVPAIVDDEDDDWIAPSKPMQPRKARQAQDEQETESIRPSMHQKSMSTTYVPSPSRPLMQSTSHHSKAQSVTISSMPPDLDSTTPAGSPGGKKHVEPMSASKKLWGAFKSARNLFASSAGSSAAAKLEAHDSPKRSKKQEAADEAKNDPMVKMPGALWSETQLSQASSRPLSTISASPSRKTRSSTESDKKQRKEMKAQAKAADEFEKAREKERLKANKAQEERVKAERVEMERLEKEQQAEEEAAAAAVERPRTAEEEKDREDMPPPPPPKSMLPPGKLRAPTRPVRPARETAASKAKPVPVNIRVASQQAQRLGQPSSQESFTSSSSSQGPPPPPKTGLRTTSAQANARASTMPQNNSRVRALEAAARKKEQEEREKQRKAEQKRELERRRAAKAEEERRLEQEKKAEEQRKLQESKLAAQRQAEKQAAEAKRREQQRFEQQQQRLEQQRLEQQRAEQSAAAKAKAAHELAEAIQRERAEKQAFPRGDAPGTLRQLGQRTVPDSSTRQIQPNPAKPPKRILSQEDDEPAPQQQRPGMQRNPTSYQQNEAKRRKTDEYDQETDQRHSVMAPPKRPSNMRKVSQSQPPNVQYLVLTHLQETLSKVPYGYSLAPPPASHHTNSMFKSTVNNQHQMQHGQRPAHPNQTVQLSNARIPFAENSNPPAAQYYSQAPSQVYGNENGAQSKFKTPARQAMSKAMPKSAAKSSPMYANGDNIALPEIMTDSEDEEDEEEEATGGFRAPSWVASPALRDLLTQQQLVDPETVFGPISDLKMEEVFKGAKNQERLKRFRDRGSSAMWHETGDAVTSEEKRRDMEARERVYKDGGWSYNNRV